MNEEDYDYDDLHDDRDDMMSNYDCDSNIPAGWDGIDD